MKFSEVKGPAYFAVIKPDSEMPILAKGSQGEVRNFKGYDIRESLDIGPDTEVQVLTLHKA